MSKTDEVDFSRINLLDEKDTIYEKIKKAKTDSIGEVKRKIVKYRFIMTLRIDLRSAICLESTHHFQINVLKR